MSTPYAKSGPLTADDLKAIWASAVDKGYREPLLAAGDGNGLEAYSQAFAQLARVAQAVDTTTQALYILPWSGQTAPPAGGPAPARVPLTFKRARFVERPLVLGAGLVFVEEQTTDWGVNPGDPGQVVQTGRRYVLADTLVFHPGETGPFDVAAVSEAPGSGYNNPLPGTIVLIDQPGAGFAHDRGNVALLPPVPPQPGWPPPYAVPSPPPAQALLGTVNEADTFIPDHVGQYVEFTAGANQGAVARIVGFTPPDPTATPPVGSTVALALDWSVESFSVTGVPFVVGELLQIKSGATVVGEATFLGARAVPAPSTHTRLTFVLRDGDVAVGNTINSATSTAAATVDVVLQRLVFTPEPLPIPPVPGSGANWRVLEWAVDVGLTCTNAAQPAGGQLGMLDALGDDRGLPRHAGEADEPYRQRLAQVADVVTPNAVRRALNRTLAATPWCFREVGSASFPGVYFDNDTPGTGPTDPGADSYDTETVGFTGAMASGALFTEPDSERVSYRDAAGNEKARGWMTRLTPVLGFDILWMVRTGLNDVQVGDFAPGDVVVGLTSGAVFGVTAIVDTQATRNALRFHLDLDYTEFRAFFLVGVPPVALGEFGIAYDFGGSDAYDAAPYPAFYDGFAAGAGGFYKRVWQAVNAVKAGGVGFDLYLERVGCP